MGRGQVGVPTLRNSWDGAEEGPTTGKACPTQGPNCVGEVFVPPNTGVTRDWGNSHNPLWHNRLFHPNVTRRQVRDEYNRGTFLECIPCNRGGQDNDERFHTDGGSFFA